MFSPSTLKIVTFCHGKILALHLAPTLCSPAALDRANLAEN
jgi:hypothetical protein